MELFVCVWCIRIHWWSCNCDAKRAHMYTSNIHSNYIISCTLFESGGVFAKSFVCLCLVVYMWFHVVVGFIAITCLDCLRGCCFFCCCCCSIVTFQFYLKKWTRSGAINTKQQQNSNNRLICNRSKPTKAINRKKLTRMVKTLLPKTDDWVR